MISNAAPAAPEAACLLPLASDGRRSWLPARKANLKGSPPCGLQPLIGVFYAKPRGTPPSRRGAAPGTAPSPPAPTRPRGGARGTSQGPARPGPADTHIREGKISMRSLPDMVAAGGGRRGPLRLCHRRRRRRHVTRPRRPRPRPRARRCPGGGSTRMPARRPARRLWSRAPRGRGGKRRNWLPGLFVPPAGLRVRPARLPLGALSRQGAL